MKLRHVFDKGSRVHQCDLGPDAYCGNLLDNAHFASSFPLLISFPRSLLNLLELHPKSTTSTQIIVSGSDLILKEIQTKKLS